MKYTTKELCTGSFQFYAIGFHLSHHISFLEEVINWLKLKTRVKWKTGAEIEAMQQIKKCIEKMEISFELLNNFYTGQIDVWSIISV